MTKDDWRALLETLLTDENDLETFCEEFREAIKDARDEKKRIPSVIEEVLSAVDGYDAEDSDTETELRDQVQQAHLALDS